ncbi:hypothetical protein [Thiobacillus sp.]|uniref:hypothetical protein n=1 Tax=Thiobacillus sp. TaxID=924 RepID=UPI0011D959B9|nr:hypothetical protein [Thiobacillus sp.]TXH75494.1 MAG: hypothetical protein E6Q82_06300 [Thiobacillus sp.]
MPYFVFVEFGNPQVAEFLVDLRNALQCTNNHSPAHVTIRGPYQTPPSFEQLEAYSERLQGYGVRISNYGYFSTPKGYAAFLRAECTVFRELWHKPDYKTPLESIKPHITMFESVDRSAALEVRAFLRNENLLIHTYNIHLRVYESRSVQGDMFGLPTVVPPKPSQHQDVWRVPRDILERARVVGSRLAESLERKKRSNF